MNSNRLLMYIAAYVFVCIAGSTVQIIPQVSLSALGAYLAALIIAPFAGGIVGTMSFILIGYMQGWPLGGAGHLMLAISVGTAAYYFGECMQRYATKPLWYRYGMAFLWGYACQVGLAMFLLWSLIGDAVLVLWLPFSLSAVLCMLLAWAVDYGWPDQFRAAIGGPLPQRKATGRNRARKRREELRTRKASQERNERNEQAEQPEEK